MHLGGALFFPLMMVFATENAYKHKKLKANEKLGYLIIG